MQWALTVSRACRQNIAGKPKIISFTDNFMHVAEDSFVNHLSVKLISPIKIIIII